MLKSKNFLKASAVFCLFLSAASCGSWRSPDSGSEEPLPTPEAASNIPFVTKEPEVFQARVLVESFGTDGMATARRYFIARNGTGLLVRFDEGSENERTLLRMDDGKSVVLYSKNKTFRTAKRSLSADKVVREVTAGWLAATPGTRFGKLSTEGKITKYKVEMEGSEGSEIYVYFDEDLGYPVKQEMFSNFGGSTKLVFRYSVSAFRLEAGKELFRVPKDYKQA